MAKATRCPLCGGKVRYPDGFDHLVCAGCCEILFVNELVPEKVPEYEVEVMFSLKVDCDEEAAYSALFDILSAIHLPAGVSWNMLEECVTEVTAA